MSKISQPTKASVRAWLQQRQRNQVPPPDIAQIRREMGWEPIKRLSESETNFGLDNVVFQPASTANGSTSH